MEAMSAHNRQAIKDLLQQLEEAQLAAKHQQQEEMQNHEAIETEKQMLLQELKVEAFLANQKQEDLIQELQELFSAKLQEDELHQRECVESEERHLLQEFQGAQQEQEKEQQQHEHGVREMLLAPDAPGSRAGAGARAASTCN